ncbi:MAG: M23 family metallopeptidase [Actinobacteria bacterium]|nr:M23 family metallopeptidase [Actinomycetota bacterium]
MTRARGFLAVLFSVLAALAAAAPAGAAPIDRFTPVAAEVLAAPEPVLASDGRQHLEYELILTNHSYPPATETVRSVQALAGGRVVGSLAGARLAAVMKPFDLGPEDASRPTRVLAPGVSATVLVDLSFPRGAKLPRRLVNRLAIAQRPPSEVIATSYLAAPTRVSTREAMVVAPPLRGPGWVIGNGCCAEPTSHRGGVLSINGGLHNGERFAIDFFQLSSDGRVVDGPREQLSSYPFYGAEVLSATAGRVVGVVDRLPDGPITFALPPITAADAGGNHVVVAIGGGRFAFYAHLQPGSVRVKVGDRVRVGQPLGLLGNSGNSNAPHLHFQLMDGPTPLASNGIPFRFSSFREEGTLANFAPVLVLGARARIQPHPRGERHRELPLDNEVVGFP